MSTFPKSTMNGLSATKKSKDHPSMVLPNPKSSMSKPSEQVYDEILHNIVEPILGDDTTFSTDIAIIGKHLFGSKWAGVFPVDAIPQTLSVNQYLVVNLDKSNEPGSHWVALVVLRKSKTTKKPKYHFLMYDSFGRSPEKILPFIEEKNNVDSTEDDSEQNIIENNCGARAITWLIMYDQFGEKAAREI